MVAVMLCSIFPTHVTSTMSEGLCLVTIALQKVDKTSTETKVMLDAQANVSFGAF